MSQHQDIRVIETRDKDGEVNGRVLLLANKFEATGPFSLGMPVEQVYVTTIRPGHVKGPHLHRARSGFLSVVKGDVAFVLRRPQGNYEVQYASEAAPRTIYVPAGVPMAMKNVGDVEALLVNVVERAWTEEAPDSHPVPEFTFDLSRLRRVSPAHS